MMMASPTACVLTVALLLASVEPAVRAQAPQPETPQPETPQPETPQPETPQPETPQPEPPFTAGWREGFVLQSEKGDFRLQIGVLVQADGRFALADDTGSITDTFLLRRVRLGLRGRFAQQFEFVINPDFAGGTAALQDAYVDTVFAPAFRIRVGKTKVPFGLERLHPASNLLFVERALPSSLAPNRDVGVLVLGDVSGGLISYSAAVMNGVAEGGSADVDTSDSKDVIGRLVVRPFTTNADGPLRGLGVGLAGSGGRHTGSAALPVFRTATLQQPYFAFSGTSADGVRTQWSPQFFYYGKTVGAFGEYVRTELPVRRGAIREEIVHGGWHFAGSIVLTGEPATDSSAGVRPRANFDFGGGHLGALQIAARYHVLKIDDRAIALNLAAAGASRKAESWTVGLNWFLTPYFKYVFNFERTTFGRGLGAPRRPEHGFAFRTQLSF